jgi:L-cysteine:1D-myo-inositol 2-amino-2-deoxy-alpha-D-glucopyranoside ligase
MTYLGTRFEIHGGGGDLLFPHHESELAQSENATGDRPFVSFWTHAGMLHYEGDKMSKSLGNLVLVRDLLRAHSGDAIRHYLVSQHYRSEVHFTDADLERSAAAVARLRDAALVARESSGVDSPQVAELRGSFLAAMDDDLDTPSATKALDALASLALGTPDSALAASAGAAVRELGGRILGLRLASASIPMEPAAA